jgi:hypothetical protein
MCTSLVRAALVCAAITAAALSNVTANAELPRYQNVVTFHSTASDHEAELGPGYPSFSGFGAAVAIRNAVAFIGIPDGFPTSRVAVYGLTATGWERTATLEVADAPVAGKNGFGRAIVFRDGLAVIASNTFLHVFKRINGTWTDIQKLAPPKSSSSASWDIGAMRLENGILVIGSSTSSSENLVYVYELAANGAFVRRATLRAPDSFATDRFGRDVAVAGNAVVVGEPLHSAAYVFRREVDGSWVAAQKLTAADASPVKSFGTAVAIDRHMIVVGAPDHECLESEVSGGGFCDPSGRGKGGPNGTGAGGAAYGFVPVAGRYVQSFKLRPRVDEHANYFQFGRRIAMMGDNIVIDAAEQSSEGEFGIGRPNGLSFTYRRDGSNVAARARGLTSGYVSSDSIGLANNWLLVGSTFDPDGFLCQTQMLSCFGEGNFFDLNRFETGEISPPQPPVLRLISARDHIEGSFTIGKMLHADDARIYLASAQGRLFVLDRDRASNFPLLQVVQHPAGLTGVIADQDNVYVTGFDGQLRVYGKTLPLQLARTERVAAFQLGGARVVDSDLYVSRGSFAWNVDRQHVFMSALNPGDAVRGFRKQTLLPTLTYGEAFVPQKTVIYDRRTAQPVFALPNPVDIFGRLASPHLVVDHNYLFRTIPGCCGDRVEIFDAHTFERVQDVIRAAANTVIRRGRWLIIGDESGMVSLWDIAVNPAAFIETIDLRQITGHTGSEDIEIRALWSDPHDNLVFAASSWGNDSSRGPNLPAFFVLELARRVQ